MPWLYYDLAPNPFQPPNRIYDIIFLQAALNPMTLIKIRIELWNRLNTHGLLWEEQPSFSMTEAANE